MEWNGYSDDTLWVVDAAVYFAHAYPSTTKNTKPYIFYLFIFFGTSLTCFFLGLSCYFKKNPDIHHTLRGPKYYQNIFLDHSL